MSAGAKMHSNTSSEAGLAASEAERLAAVHRYDVLDTPPDGAFDRVTALAARFFAVPIAIVSIVDEDRIWFKSHHGIDVQEIDRAPGLCASAILQNAPWVVNDAASDPRTLANPLVAGSLGLRFYAGVPLTTADGFNLGTLCVIDKAPRPVTDAEVATLKDLAAMVVAELELRLAARRSVDLEQQLRRQAEELVRAERRRAQLDLEYQAFHDPVTGLGNRASLTMHLEEALRRAADTGSVALLIVDLDDFRKVNDSFGHSAGDLLLVEIAGRVHECLHSPDAAARLGADEFAVVLEDTTEEQAIVVADRILDSIRAPFLLEGGEIEVDASIGIALGKGAREEAHRLLRAADLAMHAAKSQGKGGHAVFDPTMHLAALGRLALEADLRRAHSEGQLHLAYQPIVSLTNGAIVGVEALLRWHPPGKDSVGPDEFIPVAEDTGLIVPIGAWVLEQACAQARRWDETFPNQTPLTVAVNISARQLQQRGGLIEMLVEVLEKTGLEPSRLVLELTESTLINDAELALTTLQAVARLGVKLSIDDFGTGYSSLDRLRTLPIAALKIDRSFVKDIDSPDTKAPLVTAALAMARGLGLSVVAEGIETTEQLEFLCRHGCPEAQGFLLSRPVEAAAISLLLERDAPLIEIQPTDCVLDIPADRELMETIEAAVTTHEGNEAIRSLLAAMERITSLESTYLTLIHRERFEQEIRYAHNAGQLHIAESLVIDWVDTLCRQALLGGSSNTDNVPAEYPHSDAARQLGLQSYVSVPVRDADGHIIGTLCGVSLDRRKVRESNIAVLHLFARLIADKLTRPTPTESPPAADRRDR